MSSDNTVVQLRPNQDVLHLNNSPHQTDSAYYRNGGGNGGGGEMLEPRVAKLESDVSYIQRDIEKLQKDVESIDSRIGTIEAGITTMKTTFKATGIVVSVVFAFCTYVFGNYVSKILDALNGLVLK